jgi:hypothetical protein
MVTTQCRHFLAPSNTGPWRSPNWGGRPNDAKTHGSVFHAMSKLPRAAVTAGKDGTLVGTRDGQPWETWRTTPTHIIQANSDANMALETNTSHNITIEAIDTTGQFVTQTYTITVLLLAVTHPDRVPPAAGGVASCRRRKRSGKSVSPATTPETTVPRPRQTATIDAPSSQQTNATAIATPAAPPVAPIVQRPRNKCRNKGRNKKYKGYDSKQLL